jgi:hypothetical protein
MRSEKFNESRPLDQVGHLFELILIHGCDTQRQKRASKGEPAQRRIDAEYSPRCIEKKTPRTVIVSRLSVEDCPQARTACLCYAVRALCQATVQRQIVNEIDLTDQNYY